MNPKNIKSLICKLFGNEYKFFYSDYSDPLANMKVIKPKFHRIDNTVQSFLIFGDFALEGLYYDENGVLCYVTPFCKHCGSFHVIKKDYNVREVFNDDGNLAILKLKRYECKECGKKSQTELSGAFDPYAKIPTYVKEYVGLSLRNGDKTLRQHSKDIVLFTKIPISHETARKSLFTNNDDCYIKFDFNYSGFYNYDAQWLPQNGKFVYRLVLIDTIEYLPIAEAIVKKEDNETIKDFIDKSIPPHKRKAITTDSQNGYDEVMNELGFQYHQHCIFHLLQRINDLINQETNKYRKQYKKELKDSNPNYSQSKINDLVKKEAKKYRKQFEVYHDEFKEIFEQKTYDDAIKQINKVREKIDEYPTFLAEYLNKNFFPVYKRFIVFLKKEVKGKLEKTNNKCENYIGKILKKARKADFKTISGVFDYICHKVRGWFEKHLEKSTN